ncbi:MAG: glycerate kinase [Bacteroidota bacterium]|nr:glycerate kinase [Bacteroidota bacterium]
MDAKKIAEQIFMAGVESVLPGKMIRNKVYIKDSILFISSLQLQLTRFNRIYVIGAGKASALMAKEIENILGNRITEGQIVVKYGHACELQYINVTEAAHPVPDENGYWATQRILAIAKQANENDLIICLVSGGGSALLADFPEGSTLKDIILINDLLLKSGADINEMNAVRKHFSKVKGGQLAKAAQPATLVSLILSDVIGDSLDVIASGPTAPDATTFDDAFHVLEKYDLLKNIPQSLIQYLKNGIDGAYPETPKSGDPLFSHIHNMIIGSNKIALAASRVKAQELDLNPVIITGEFEGDTSKMAIEMVNTAIEFQKDSNIKKPCCLLFGGETTLKVKGKGLGGRNQHLALCTALLLKGQNGITLLSAGTDGNDGPTPAAGAVVDTKLSLQALLSGLDAQKYLENFDSFHFFEKAGGHIISGPTMTNVMDLVIIIVEGK